MTSTATSEPTGIDRRANRAVRLLGLGTFIFSTSEFIISGLLTEIAGDLRVDLTRAGLLISVFALAMVVCTPLSAVFTIRLHHRTTIFLALSVFVASNACCALAPSYSLLLAARVVTAAATGVFWAAASLAVIRVCAADRRARSLAVLTAGLTTATVLGVPLGTLLGQRWGWQSTFWVVAALAACLAPFLYRALPRRVTSADPTPRLRREIHGLATRQTSLAITVIVVFETGVMCCLSYLSPMVTGTAGLPPSFVGAAFGLLGVGCVLGSQLGGRLADAHPWTTSYVSLASSVLLLAALAGGAPVPWLALGVVPLLGVAVFAAGAPLVARLFAVATGSPNLAGFANPTAFNIGNTLGPVVGGVVLGVGWDVRVTALVGGVFVAAALWLVWLSHRHERRDAAK